MGITRKLMLGFAVVSVLYGLSTSLECEVYNITECSSGSTSCDTSRGSQICGGDPTSSSHTLGCFALWQRNPETGQEILQFKGCFINNKDCVGLNSCVDREHRVAKAPKNNSSLHTHYCCCETDNCNTDYAWQPNPTPPPLIQRIIDAEQVGVVRPWIWISTLAAVFCILCVLIALLVHRQVERKPLPLSSSNLADEENDLLEKSESYQMLSPVTLVELKATGRFGSVWKAEMVGQEDYVAVKILPMREKTSWRLEQEVYSLPLMCDSKLILGYFGSRSDPELMQLWLISEYISRGSLYDYLKGHELSWSDVLTISMSMCQGLAFLHDEINTGMKGDKDVKPAVAHRDFKSKNVLLRGDLTACIADFGLAHIFYPKKPVGTNHGQVGTRRYMAPEVLDGAVSFTRDNFQRIDMYACGLVLWELASRCSATKGPIGEYRLPFEEHVGNQPTLEEMIECVVTQRKRPTLRSEWLSHPGLSILFEAIKDSWDQDSEARISASCIVERLNNISNMIA